MKQASMRSRMSVSTCDFFDMLLMVDSIALSQHTSPALSHASVQLSPMVPTTQSGAGSDGDERGIGADGGTVGGGEDGGGGTMHQQIRRLLVAIAPHQGCHSGWPPGMQLQSSPVYPQTLGIAGSLSLLPEQYVGSSGSE